jgi:hypothetical protein
MYNGKQHNDNHQNTEQHRDDIIKPSSITTIIIMPTSSMIKNIIM